MNCYWSFATTEASPIFLNACLCDAQRRYSQICLSIRAFRRGPNAPPVSNHDRKATKKSTHAHKICLKHIRYPTPPLPPCEAISLPSIILPCPVLLQPTILILIILKSPLRRRKEGSRRGGNSTIATSPTALLWSVAVVLLHRTLLSSIHHRVLLHLPVVIL